MLDTLSFWGMISAADPFVKGVMGVLALASVLSWTIFLAKTCELSFALRRLRQQNQILRQSTTLPDTISRGELETGLRAVLAEYQASSGLAPSGVKERIASCLAGCALKAGQRRAGFIALLATIGATAPFVGLFGTVWGVMNSFLGIAKQHTTNLAVVAPGLAEALLATALGLAVAIPAVVLYNLLARRVAFYRAEYSDGTAVILRLASRDLDRQAT